MSEQRKTFSREELREALSTYFASNGSIAIINPRRMADYVFDRYGSRLTPGYGLCRNCGEAATLDENGLCRICAEIIKDRKNRE
ncbi:hypothetical protein [Bifidobacterium callitrichidarum]|uniref:Uncharacterized protein n=1 Tax=Bifidobacterium callitrichidarum TaxID=2052941 RepID=A0A2U2N8W3_9BIFI|nr:hypothetical protein [Bifidobacterium callitrichidarum]PWG65621.1 hypothetical protein DF196_06725 [Bifidobacterium callitrichidarum]